MKKQKIYSKAEAIEIMVKTARLYKENLENKTLVILYKEKNSIKQYEVTFGGSNFLHYTGVKTKLSSNDFYDAALSNRLKENDFAFKSDYITSEKLDVLEQAVNFPHSAKMIGVYNGPKIKLQTDYGAGNTCYVMTFRSKNSSNWMYPVGVLKEDIRDVTAKSPIVAILSKKSHDKYYDNITYISKNINISNLHFPKEIKEKLSESAYHTLKPEQTK